jgi:hypothetical protein
MHRTRTAKSCGPDASTLASTRDNANALRGDGDKKPDHRLFDSHILEPQSGAIFNAAEGFEA